MFQANEFVEVTVMPDETRLAATIRHSDGQHLLMAVETQDAALLLAGGQVQLVQTLDGGLYQCNSVIVNRRENMVVAKMGAPQLLQRRRAKRFDCCLEALYRVNLKLADLLTTSKVNLTAAQVHDLSLGGAKLHIDSFICARTPLGVRIQLTPKDAINVEATIVRCTQVDPADLDPNGSLPYAIAVRFGAVPRIDQVTLHRFLVQAG